MYLSSSSPKIVTTRLKLFDFSLSYFSIFTHCSIAILRFIENKNISLSEQLWAKHGERIFWRELLTISP